MTRFPNTRMAVARIFANLSICALPMSERSCLDVAFSYADLLRIRAQTIRTKGQHWRFENHLEAACDGADDPEERCPRHPRDCTCWNTRHPSPLMGKDGYDV